MMETEQNSLYDQRSACKETEILKALLPYLNSTSQKNLSMMICFLQLQKTMEFFENPENTMQICAMDKKETMPEILQAIRCHCNETEKLQIDHLINAMQMMSTYEILFNGGMD